MPFARILASNPSAARDTAQALRQAGYEVEIVPPGTPATRLADLEFDADTDSVVSESQPFVPGEREFVLKPLWRKMTARFHATKDVARAQQQMNEARVEAAPKAYASFPASQSQVEELLSAAVLPDNRKSDEAARIEMDAQERSRREADAQRQEELRRHEILRQQQEALRQEVARQREEEMQRVELARQREEEQQRLAVLRLAEERRVREEGQRREAAEATRHAELARQREEVRQQEMQRRQAEEEHRREVLRQRQDEEHIRRAEGQRMLIEANKQREESFRQRTAEISAAVTSVPITAAAVSVPTFREYLGQRVDHWKQQREAKEKVTRIDRSGKFARQAWPITAGVAAAFLLGWGVAVHEASKPKAHTAPPILTPGQYGAYPVAKASPSRTVMPQSSAPQVQIKPKTKRSAVRDNSIAQDEVVVKHYYPSKGVTAQNRVPQRKKISDLN